MNTGSLEDRLAIRELIEAFAVGAIHIDAEIWGDTWAEQSAWQLSSMPVPVEGKRNIIAKFKEAMSYVEFMSLICFPYAIEIAGASARGKTYCREMIISKNGGEIFVVGRYHDQYVKQDGRWLFLSRVYEVIGRKDKD